MSIITRLRRGLSALGALAAIATLLAGVPVFLWKTVGRPLPTRLPSWSEFSSALSHTEIPASALTKTLACFGWIAWTLIAVSIGMEVTAWLAGTTARQLRFGGPFQPLARSLVTSAAVLITLNPLSSSSFAAATSMPGSLALVRATATVSAAPHRVLEPLKGDQFRLVSADRTAVIKTTEDPPSLTKQQTVQRHDTLWDLAERHLGDPYRWNEIWDLNCGQTQADGSVFTDAHWIRPGWVLTMPADAMGVTELAPVTQAVPSPPPSTDEAAVPSAPPSTQPEAVDPPATATTPTVASTTTQSTYRPLDAPASTSSGARSDQPPVVPGSDTTAWFPTRVPWIAGGLCAAGIVVLLDRLRRAQRRRRKPGDPLHNPPTELAPLETGLRRSAAASEDRCQLLDAALRAFAAGAFGDPAMRTPRLLAVRSYSDSVELLLDEPLEGSVLGFTAQSDNRLWVTEPGLTVELLQRLADEVGAPYPALVTLGEVDGGDLLVDVETAGMLSVHADGGAARDLFRRVAIELATSRWGEYFEVITVGDVPDFAGFERNRRLPTVSDALDALAASAREIEESLLALGAKATVAPRVSYALGDGWVPSIFVTDQLLTARDIERLRSIVADGGRGVGALVLASRPQGKWNLSCVDGNAHLTPLDIHLSPLSIPMEHAEAIEELLHDAAVGHLDADEMPPSDHCDTPAVTPDAGPQVPGDEPEAPVTEKAERDELVSSAAVLADGDVVASNPPMDPVVPLVRVLGAVGIDNIDHEGRRKVVELIVYLALHPDGVGADRLTEALWPDAAPEPRTLTRNVCYARKALGLDADGNNHLPRINTEGRYRLGPHVRCDLLELIQLAKKARETADTDARLRMLEEALDLIRDKPFDSVIDYEWAWTENWVAVAESEAADAAVLLSGTHLAMGRSEEAVRASLVGLRAAPDDARLQDLRTGIPERENSGFG